MVGMPVAYVVLTSLNLLTLRIISRISAGLAINPYHNHSALVVCDLVLLNLGVFRFYLEFLGLQWHLQAWCQWPWSQLALFTEPLLLGVLSADQLIVLLLTLDQLFLLTYPHRYVDFNPKWKAIVGCLLSIFFSLLVTILTTKSYFITDSNGCSALQEIYGTILRSHLSRRTNLRDGRILRREIESGMAVEEIRRS